MSKDKSNSKLKKSDFDDLEILLESCTLNPGDSEAAVAHREKYSRLLEWVKDNRPEIKEPAKKAEAKKAVKKAAKKVAAPADDSEDDSFPEDLV